MRILSVTISVLTPIFVSLSTATSELPIGGSGGASA